MYNLFYEEPANDRWLKYDRYPRNLIRRIIRGPQPIGGVKRWFINLCLGLDKLGIKYTVNDYKYLRKHPGSWALVVGKPHVIEKIPNNINIIYGPGIAAHPYENDFWQNKSNIKTILISCDWFKKMYDRDLDVQIPTIVWPSGVETERWVPTLNKSYQNSILIYDKIRWNRHIYQTGLLDPIQRRLEQEGINVKYIKYGNYKEEDFKMLLQQVDGMIFLCEHETQGFAYLQTLASGVPILAWDRGGYWQDPSMYPDSVKFQPVTAVPYWDNRCGDRFIDLETFESSFATYWSNVLNQKYSPRDYVLENFKLEDCAKKYIEIVNHTIADESPLYL